MMPNISVTFAALEDFNIMVFVTVHALLDQLPTLLGPSVFHVMLLVLPAHNIPPSVLAALHAVALFSTTNVSLPALSEPTQSMEPADIVRTTVPLALEPTIPVLPVQLEKFFTTELVMINVHISWLEVSVLSTVLLDSTRPTPINVKDVILHVLLAMLFLKTVPLVLQDSLIREDVSLLVHSASSVFKESVNNATLNVMDVSILVLPVSTALLDSSNVDHHAVKYAHPINLLKVLSILASHAILNVEPVLPNNSVLLVPILKPSQSTEYVTIALIHARLVELHHLSVLLVSLASA